MADSQSIHLRRPTQSGPANPNWRGGRTVTPDGYVLIRVGTAHHLADVRGYAYEHHLVAEESLGRRLEADELVHHRDENKQNNAPDNLLVCRGNAEHFVHHRTRDDLQAPGAPNPERDCECGCGTKFLTFDHSGRPRRFVTGHNPPSSPVQDAVLRAFQGGSANYHTLLSRTNLPVDRLKHALSRLRKSGLVRRVRYGIWEAC